MTASRSLPLALLLLGAGRWPAIATAAPPAPPAPPAPYAAVQPADLLALPVAPGARRLAYGPGEFEFGELRLPSGRGPHALVVLVHGGCWASALPDLPGVAVSLALLRPMAAALTAAGYATWNLEYRRPGNPGGGWPATFTDLGRGLDFVRALARSYPLDAERTVVLGHSSGGQLALWLAARARLAPDSELYVKAPLRPRGVIDVDGPPDLALMRPFEAPVCNASVITELMGGPPDAVPRRYADASATGMLPLGVRQVIVVGALMDMSSVRPLVDRYVLAARAQGDELRLSELPAAGHFGMLAPAHPAFALLLEDIGSLTGKPSKGRP
jgi:acetyl esterase/lipase